MFYFCLEGSALRRWPFALNHLINTSLCRLTPAATSGGRPPGVVTIKLLPSVLTVTRSRMSQAVTSAADLFIVFGRVGQADQVGDRLGHWTKLFHYLASINNLIETLGPTSVAVINSKISGRATA